MEEKFMKTAIRLKQLMETKVLGEFLMNEAFEYITILIADNCSYEEKHKANILAENLLGNTRDFPDLGSSIKRGRR